MTTCRVIQTSWFHTATLTITLSLPDDDMQRHPDELVPHGHADHNAVVVERRRQTRLVTQRRCPQQESRFTFNAAVRQVIYSHLHGLARQPCANTLFIRQPINRILPAFAFITRPSQKASMVIWKSLPKLLPKNVTTVLDVCTDYTQTLIFISRDVFTRCGIRIEHHIRIARTVWITSMFGDGVLKRTS